MKTTKPAIVLPVYNRPELLSLLLASINRAIYPDTDIELILSIEAGAPDSIMNIAESFAFKYGPKTIVQREERLGVKAHIMACADLSERFGSVIILEDDLIVSPDYYLFASEALNAYQNDDRVAGIALYAQRFNETAQLPFEPMPGDYSVWFMQLGCSWGQAWTAAQWTRFRKWLDVSKEISDRKLPPNMREWDDESWKKRFNLYMLETRTYFAYPYRSFTTTHSEFGGQHMSKSDRRFQVPLGYFSSEKPSFNFPRFKDQPVRYDMYMEFNAAMLALKLEFKYHELCVDLYGTKPDEELKQHNYVLTPRKGPDPLSKFSVNLKPLELNILIPSKIKQQPIVYLYSRDQISSLKQLSHSQYAELASYFSYFKPESRKFVKGFLPNLYRKILNLK
ncbi:MAG: glycosyltransferase family 2 protein [Balneolaceae bacterium]|nr:MAG: glycosyltransferase family 2 protein [Balneolaceae bacterium]